jgi:uncharacterized protein (DUF1330 family)
MAAYVIVDIDIVNPTEYERYKELTPVSLAAYGGKFVVRGGQAEALEGDWKPSRVVVLEFADRETAKRWWDSPEYAPAKIIRHQNAGTKMIVVDGV